MIPSSPQWYQFGWKWALPVTIMCIIATVCGEGDFFLFFLEAIAHLLPRKGGGSKKLAQGTFGFQVVQSQGIASNKYSGEEVKPMFLQKPSSDRPPSNRTGDQLPQVDSLFDRARNGEAEALSTLYHHFLPAVFGYIASRTADRSTAEDLTSEVFLKMVEGIHRVKANTEVSFAAWLFQIARITVADHYRKREKQPAQVSLESTLYQNGAISGNSDVIMQSDPTSDPVQWSEARDEWRVVVGAINLLTEEQRQVLISRLILGYDIATIAKMLGKQANAIKALQFRALQSLERLLAKKGQRDKPLNHVRQQEEVR